MATNKQIRNALSSVGGSLGPKEIARIKRETGATSGIKEAARGLGINIKGSSSSSSSSSNPLLTFGLPGFGEGLAPAEFDFQSTIGAIRAQGGVDTGIAKLNADAAKAVERLRGKSARDVANIEAGATRYQADIGLRGVQYQSDKELEATRYQADRQLEAALGVENIRTKGAIDLQGIVNAGLERVEGIRGEYGLKGKMLDRGTSIYAGLVNAFNFS